MALFNGGYPATYQPQMYQQPNYSMQSQPTQMQTMPQTSNYSDMIFVQGKEAAKVYPVARGNSVVLFDSEGDKFYIKAVDNTGMPMRLRTFSYVEVMEDEPHGMSSLAPQEIDTSQFATKAEMNSLINTVDALATKVQSIEIPKIEEKPKTTTTRKVKDGE